VPHIKYPEEVIFDAAFELAKDYGMEKVTSDAVAAKLGCSKQPIYSAFKNMVDLKNAVLQRATKKYAEFLFTERPGVTMTISIALNYVRFAREYPHLFRFIFFSDRGENVAIVNHRLDENKPKVVEIIKNEHKLTDSQAEDHYIKMGIFCNGIAAMIISKTSDFSDKDILRLINEVRDGILSVK